MFQTISSKSYLFPGSSAKFHFPGFFSDFKLGVPKKKVAEFFRISESWGQGGTCQRSEIFRTVEWLTQPSANSSCESCVTCWIVGIFWRRLMSCFAWKEGDQKKEIGIWSCFFSEAPNLFKEWEIVIHLCLIGLRIWDVYIYILYYIYISIIRIQYYNLYVYIWYYINVRALFGPVLWATNEVPNSSWGNCLFSSPVIESKKIIQTHVIFQKSILSVFVEHQHQASFWINMSRNTTVPTKTPNEVPPCYGVEKLLVAATVTMFAGAVLIA